MAGECRHAWWRGMLLFRREEWWYQRPRLWKMEWGSRFGASLPSEEEFVIVELNVGSGQLFLLCISFWSWAPVTPLRSFLFRQISPDLPCSVHEGLGSPCRVFITNRG